MAVCRTATAGCETVDAYRERVTRNSLYEPQRNVVRSERRRVPKGVLSRDAGKGTQGTWPGLQQSRCWGAVQTCSNAPWARA